MRIPGCFQVELQAWDVWNTETAQTGSRQQANGTQQKVYHSHSAQDVQDAEPEPDYFQDMTPHFKRPAKVSDSAWNSVLQHTNLSTAAPCRHLEHNELVSCQKPSIDDMG